MNCRRVGSGTRAARGRTTIEHTVAPSGVQVGKKFLKGGKDDKLARYGL